MFDDLIKLLIEKEPIHNVYFLEYEDIQRIKEKMDITSSVTNAIEKNLQKYLSEKPDLNIIVAMVREQVLICLECIDIACLVVSSSMPDDLKVLSHYLSQMKGMLSGEGGENFNKELKLLEQLQGGTTFINPLDSESPNDPYV